MPKPRKPLPSQRVKAIRNTLGLTQSELAELLKVSQATVARWESGTRACKGRHATDLLAAAARRESRTTTIFSVEPHHLARLDADDAVRASRDLLRAYCSTVRHPTHAARSSLREVSDGGIDATAHIDGEPPEGGLLASGTNAVQIKTGTAFKPWQLSQIERELLRGGSISEQLREHLDSGGRYVLACFGYDLLPTQSASALKHIRETFSRQGFEQADIVVLGQSELCGHFERFPSLALRLAGHADVEAITVDSWGAQGAMSLDFHPGQKQEGLIRRIQLELCAGEARHIRVVGEPGIGKSRLVLEAVASCDLAPAVLYVPQADAFERSRLFHQLMRRDHDFFTVLVLDECGPRRAKSVWDSLRAHSDRCLVVSIDHDSFAITDPLVLELQCPPLGEAELRAIIKGYVTGREDAGRWARLCSGSPRVAHAVGASLSMGSPDVLASMKDVWTRYVAGSHDLSTARAREKLTVLRHLALFYRFGFESPVVDEAKAVSQLVEVTDPNITWPRFQEIVLELKAQRILQGRTTLFMAPRLLQVHLWSEFWQTYGRQFSSSDLLSRLPPQLAKWYMRMFIYGAESDVAQHHIAVLLGDEGPFAELNYATTEEGSEFLLHLSEASPEAVLTRIEKVLAESAALGMSLQSCQRNLVWALENIVVESLLFHRAACALRKLARADEGTHFKSATQIFRGLFSMMPGQMAPTAAPPARRMRILRECLQSDDDWARTLGMEACETTFGRGNELRTIGREHHGVRRTYELWTPDTWGEVHQAIGVVWLELRSSSRTWDSKLRSRANSVMIDGAKDLLGIASLRDEILNTLDMISTDTATDESALVRFLIHVKKYKSEGYDAEVLRRLEAIDERITGSTLRSRIRRFVAMGEWIDMYTEEGASCPSMKSRLGGLAAESLSSSESLGIALDELAGSSSPMCVQFGQALSALEPTNERIGQFLGAFRAQDGMGHPALLAGFLRGRFLCSPQEWERCIAQLLADPALRWSVPHVFGWSGYSELGLLRLLDAIDNAELDPVSLRALRYPESLQALSAETMTRLLQQVVTRGDTEAALNYVAAYYCEKGKTRPLPKEWTLELLRTSKEAKTRRGQSTFAYRWATVARELTRQDEDTGTSVFSLAMSRVVTGEWALRRTNPASQLVEDLVRDDPPKCWDLVKANLSRGDRDAAWHTLHWLGASLEGNAHEPNCPLTWFPVDLVMQWVESAPEQRAMAIARALPTTLGPEREGEYGRQLLDAYGADDVVARAVRNQFSRGGWTGPESEHLESKLTRGREWLSTCNSIGVRLWLEEWIAALRIRRDDALLREERTSW